MKRKDIDLSSLVRPNILALAPYSTARDEYDGPLGVFLDANESPYENGFNRYPDPYQKSLKECISKLKGVSTEKIFIGNGSDEAIDLAFRVFCEPGIDNVVSITPTYGMYRVAADINNVEVREVALNSDFSLSAANVLAATDIRTKLIFLCSPNNPTGNLLSTEEIEKTLDNFNGIVVIDEAYIDFAEQPSFLERIDEFSNLIILQTLSKARGLAGLRLGMAFASTDIISLLTRVKYPYNINGITQELVFKELCKDISTQVKEIVSERKRVIKELGNIELAQYIYASDANFILVRFKDPRMIYKSLINAGIIVRDRSSIKGCEGCLRITIGTPEENNRLITILKEL